VRSTAAPSIHHRFMASQTIPHAPAPITVAMATITRRIPTGTLTIKRAHRLLGTHHSTATFLESAGRIHASKRHLCCAIMKCSASHWLLQHLSSNRIRHTLRSIFLSMFRSDFDLISVNLDPEHWWKMTRHLRYEIVFSFLTSIDKVRSCHSAW